MSYSSQVLADTPLAYYRLNESSGTAMADSSGNAHGGTYYATKTAAAGLLTAPDGATAQSGWVPTASWLDVSSITVEFLMNPSAISGNQGIVTRYSGGQDWLVWMNTSSKLAARFYNTGGGSVDLVWATTPTVGSTYHVVATYQSGQARLYVNGSQVDSSTALTGSLRTSVQNLEIDTYATNTWTFSGVVDEVAIYSGELSAARVSAHYAAITDPATSGASGTAAGAYAYSGTAVGHRQVGTAAGAYAYSGTAVGFASTGTPIASAAGAYVYSGSDVEGYAPSVPPPELPIASMAFKILDPAQRRAPTALTVTVSGAWSNGPVDFWVDLESTDPDYTVIADGNGDVDAVSIPVEHDTDAGTHIMIAKSTNLDDVTAPARYDSAEFTLAVLPTSDTIMGPDADPVEVPGALNDDGSRNWVFQDLMPGGLGSYLFPRNPRSFTTPITFRDLTTRRSTSVDGRHHITEAHDQTTDFIFAGEVFTEDEQQALENYWNLDRRCYLIDHENRAWTVALARVEFTHRLRTRYHLPGEADVYSDLVAEYTATAHVYGRSRAPVPLGP